MSAPISGQPDLRGQTALITGAAGGIGQAVAESLATEGADILAVDIDEDGLEAVSEAVEAKNQACETVCCDVTDRTEITALSDTALAEFETIEMVVTAAGIGSADPTIDESPDSWSEIIGTNLTATFETCRQFFGTMVDNGYGKIVTIGSIAGQTGRLRAGPAYSASKGGVHALTQWLAAQGAGHTVYANCIAPGPIRTELTDMGEHIPLEDHPLDRLGEPEDVAQAAVFLCSQQSNWISGSILDLNGGQLMR